jgi:radical SAM superfamily enzyme YgiQ (UPF0313 family)
MMKFLLVAINAKYIHSNPGIYSLKAYAEQGGADPAGQFLPELSGEHRETVQIEIAEYTINNQMEQILEDIYRRKPDMVGFSCYIWNMNDALNLVHDLHKVLPETDIWMGGPEVTYDAPELLKREPEILGVMKGEGEDTFASLRKCYELLGTSVRRSRGGMEMFWNRMAQIPSLTYRNTAGDIFDQPVRPVLDMSKIPFLYPTLAGFENRIVYYESSRGCPFSCSYCLSSVDKSVRFRDIELVKQELQYFLDRKVPQVKFVDRTFNCKKSHAMGIWQYLLEHDNGVTNFHFEIAADLLDEDELELMKKMRPGLIQLEIGVQSTNPATITEIRRKMDLNRVKQIVEQINAGHNIHQHLDLIVGLPYEDYDTFKKSFNEVYAMRPEQLQMGFLKVLKGSYMQEKVQDYELVYRELPPYEVLSTKWLPYSDVLRLKGVEDALEVHYNSGQFACTLELLEQDFADAFTMYERLAEYYDRNGLNGRSHSRVARYEILHEFICGLSASRTPADYEDALMIDMYLRENCKSRPSFALDQTPYKEMVKKLVPELRQLGAMVHAEVLRSGAVCMFDYREKDPLTKNAKLTYLREK